MILDSSVCQIASGVISLGVLVARLVSMRRRSTALVAKTREAMAPPPISRLNPSPLLEERARSIFAQEDADPAEMKTSDWMGYTREALAAKDAAAARAKVLARVNEERSQQAARTEAKRRVAEEAKEADEKAKMDAIFAETIKAYEANHLSPQWKQDIASRVRQMEYLVTSGLMSLTQFREETAKLSTWIEDDIQQYKISYTGQSAPTTIEQLRQTSKCHNCGKSSMNQFCNYCGAKQWW